MFDFWTMTRLAPVIEKYPRELIGAVAAVWIVTDISARLADVRKEKIKAESGVRAAELRVAAARLELELAQLKLNNMP